MLVSGGINSKGHYLADYWLFDLVNKTWLELDFGPV